MVILLQVAGGIVMGTDGAIAPGGIVMGTAGAIAPGVALGCPRATSISVSILFFMLTFVVVSTF